MRKINIKDFKLDFGYEKLIKDKLLENYKKTIRF